METRLKALSPKIGVVLFQLPPQSFALRHSSPDLIANAQLAVARNMLPEPESLPPPRDFLFAWKASKFITLWKRLGEACATSIELMETRLKALSPKIGVVLLLLPPQSSKNRE